MNNVVIVGRLTKDPELKYLTSGTAVATFTMAIDRDYKNKDGSITTDFIPVEIMGKPAEFVANYITKGRLVAIQGSVRVDRYETPDGEKRTFTKVAGRNIQALESKSKVEQGEQAPQESPAEFSAVDDDDVPF
jgi:single-strand binding protein